jgi:hypothetical protein
MLNEMIIQVDKPTYFAFSYIRTAPELRVLDLIFTVRGIMKFMVWDIFKLRK